MKYIKNLMTNIICLFKFNLVKDYDAFIDHVDKLNARIDKSNKKRDINLDRLVDLEYEVSDIKDNDLWEFEKSIDKVASDVKTIIQVHLMDFNDSLNDVENSINDIKDDIKNINETIYELEKATSLLVKNNDDDSQRKLDILTSKHIMVDLVKECIKTMVERLEHNENV